MNKGYGSRWAFFLTGLSIGATVTLILAPFSGPKMRKYIVDKTGEGKDYLGSKGQRLGKQAGQLLGRGKGWVVKGKDRLTEAWETGKRASRDKMV